MSRKELVIPIFFGTMFLYSFFGFEYGADGSSERFVWNFCTASTGSFFFIWIVLHISIKSLNRRISADPLKQYARQPLAYAPIDFREILFFVLLAVIAFAWVYVYATHLTWALMSRSDMIINLICIVGASCSGLFFISEAWLEYRFKRIIQQKMLNLIQFRKN